MLCYVPSGARTQDLLLVGQMCKTSMCLKTFEHMNCTLMLALQGKKQSKDIGKTFAKWKDPTFVVCKSL